MKLETVASRLVQLGFVVALVGAWHYATSRGLVGAFLLPPPEGVWKQFLLLLKSGNYLPDLKVTLFELLVAFSIASLSGCIVGYLISRSRYLTRTFEPLLAGIFSIPAILIYPLYLLFFGLGPASKIAIGVTIGFFPVALNTIAGFANVDRVLIAAARSMGASGWNLFARVLLPAAFPVIVTGLRMAFIIGLLAILGTETLASLSGLGHRIVALGEAMNTTQMYAWIGFVILIALVLNALVSRFESLFTRER